MVWRKWASAHTWWITMVLFVSTLNLHAEYEHCYTFMSEWGPWVSLMFDFFPPQVVRQKRSKMLDTRLKVLWDGKLTYNYTYLALIKALAFLPALKPSALLPMTSQTQPLQSDRDLIANGINGSTHVFNSCCLVQWHKYKSKSNMPTKPPYHLPPRETSEWENPTPLKRAGSEAQAVNLGWGKLDFIFWPPSTASRVPFLPQRATLYIPHLPRASFCNWGWYCQRFHLQPPSSSHCIKCEPPP